MFRRKDEEMNDATSSTPGTFGAAEASESATVLPRGEGSAYSPSSATPASSGGTGASPYGATGAYGSAAARPGASAPEARPESARPEPARADAPRTAAAPFRAPASASAMEMPRGRGQEKANAASAGNAVNPKENRRVLTVGSDILLKGEIATCDRLVIEGKVDATLNEVHTVEIAESGSFKGTAEIEYAEISGLFEGELVVRNRLVIYGTGKVRGKITYGEIEIERGGELTGEIKSNASDTAYSRVAGRDKEKAAA